MAHKMGKQPEEAGNFHSKVAGSVPTKAAGRTEAAGHPIAASGKAIGDASSTKMAGDEAALFAYTRKSGSIGPSQTPTSRLGDEPRK